MPPSSRQQKWRGMCHSAQSAVIDGAAPSPAEQASARRVRQADSLRRNKGAGLAPIGLWRFPQLWSRPVIVAMQYAHHMTPAITRIMNLKSTTMMAGTIRVVAERLLARFIRRTTRLMDQRPCTHVARMRERAKVLVLIQQWHLLTAGQVQCVRFGFVVQRRLRQFRVPVPIPLALYVQHRPMPRLIVEDQRVLVLAAGALVGIALACLFKCQRLGHLSIVDQAPGKQVPAVFDFVGEVLHRRIGAGHGRSLCADQMVPTLQVALGSDETCDRSGEVGWGPPATEKQTQDIDL